MAKEYLVSIILVNYNGWRYCNECINSLFECSYKNFHVIIVDNGSNGSNKLDKKYVNNTKVTTLFLNDNVGFAAANNIGIEYANNILHTDYIMLLNNDTEVQGDFLNQLIECCKNYNNKAVVTGKIYYFYDKKKLWYAGGKIDLKKGLAHHSTLENDKEMNEAVSFASGCMLFMHKNLANEVGPISEDYFLYYEDADYSVKILNKGFQIIYCPKAIIYHKVNATVGEMSNISIYYSTRNRLLFISKYGESKLRGYISTLLMIMRCVIRKPSRYYILYLAVRDFLFNNYGRQDKI